MVWHIPFSEVPSQRFGPPQGDAVWITMTRENDLRSGWAVCRNEHVVGDSATGPSCGLVAEANVPSR